MAQCEVLGGLHTLIAKSQLVEEYPLKNRFFNADVYVGLNDEEALRLAQCHNLNFNFIHHVMHRGLVSWGTVFTCNFNFLCVPLTYVEACRAQLHTMEGTNGNGETKFCEKAIIPEV